GLRIVIDWVPNHTSDRHPWFESSRRSREDAKRDWYVWRDPAPGGGPPNDWESAFRACGAAWTLDETTGQYWLHSFMPEQPDLNWDNPEVETAMHETLRFWLDRGVDGFRLDAVNKIAKDPLLRDNAGADRRHDEDWDSIWERLRRIRRVVDEYPGRMLVGETHGFELDRLVRFVDAGDGLHLAHNFMFAMLLPWEAQAFRSAIDEFEAATRAWPAWFLANHDTERSASRFDHDGLGRVRARAIALMLYALRGTPFVYQGEELGLPGADVPPERVVDLDGRDPQRAPMPWRPLSEAGPGAGFTSGAPWLPLVADAEALNVASQAADPRSMLTLVRRLAALRAATPALQAGSQRSLDASPDVLAWAREHDDLRLLAALNFAAAPASLGLREGRATVLLSTDPDRSEDEADLATFALGPCEAVILRPRD
ncbi:MAG: alpha-glucosidase, partial [Thermoleophilaceae bacterium]|nr:alpha-glucosidase [Thermoleophilaceae bacterium]